MADFTDTDSIKAEARALDREVARLSRQFGLNNTPVEDTDNVNTQDVFKNPTEYHDYNEDYSKILPWVKTPEYELPVEPSKLERKNLKRPYSIGGWCLLFHFFTSNALGILLITVISLIISALNNDADITTVTSYMHGSSITAGLNTIIYITANVGFAMLGFKWSKTDRYSIIKPQKYNFAYAVQYCIIAVFIWVAAAYLSQGIEQIFGKFGYTTVVSDTGDIGVTGIGFAVMTVYSCIIAPITEELFYRGMLLKVFSRANQRFAIVATAVFFGLGHGNLPQFMLAFLLGIFLAHITMKHNSIVPSIIVHIFVNSMVTVISYSEELHIQDYMISLALLGCAAAGMILLLFFRRKDKIPATTPHQSRRGFAVAKSSVPLTLAFCVEIIYLALLISDK